MTEVRVTVEGLETVAKRIDASEKAIEKALAATAVAVEDAVEAGVAPHSKAGALERSIFKAKITGGWEIGHHSQVAPHARFVHDGTRPHVIRPKERKALRWPTPGGFAFAREVHHPGYRGDAWLRRAAKIAVPTSEAFLKTTMRGV